ncbi:response regulator [Desulfovibrio sp.]|uniref:response regulator n=1 Tax=Desulfovibrio sp. TaxID=885 RepID=UPI000AA43A5C|nr:response regulator [Desulfovibrio sp.]MDY0260487.1 response regulator [Desulfovibrio sp.]
MIRTIIVEDDPMVADLAAGYLERIDGFSLDHTARSAEDALDLLRACHVDLVLLDVFMPGMDGMELLRIIKSQFFHTDVIMITAAQSSEDILKALRLGVADYIVKPFTFERFRESMLQFQEKRRLLMSPEVAITQDILDRRIFIKKPERGAGRPKGIDAQTLETVVSVLKEQPGLFSLKDIERLAGISRISLKKYFDYLAETGRLGSSKGYGGQGRPVTLYNWLG